MNTKETERTYLKLAKIERDLAAWVSLGEMEAGQVADLARLPA